MIRDIDRLTARTFELLVVRGIYGWAIAYDAAQRDHFGSGSSFNHLRTIHGGLRYLQIFDILARASRFTNTARSRASPRTRFACFPSSWRFLAL